VTRKVKCRGRRRGQGRAEGNMLCLCGVGKLIIVWVLCHCNLYELFQLHTLFFLCCFGETKAFLERHSLCPCVQENAQELGEIADKDKLWRGRSLPK